MSTVPENPIGVAADSEGNECSDSMIGEKKLETATKVRIFPAKKRYPEDDYDSDDNIDEEAFKHYANQIRESEGFDVDSYHTWLMGGIAPVDKEDLEDPVCEEQFGNYARKAIGIEYHNNPQKDEKLELVSILNCNVQVVCGMLYYLTISAKNVAGVTKIYQTRVGDIFTGDSKEPKRIEVEMFREKPSTVVADQGRCSSEA